MWGRFRKSSRTWWIIAFAAAVAQAVGMSLTCASAARAQQTAQPPVWGYQIVNTFPHDPNAFCQGLVVEGDVLYEGTGRYGQSALRKVDLKTGKVLRVVPLSRRYFGEGIAISDDTIVQLTWKGRAGFVYDKQTFRRRGSFRYTGEGWGITSDGKRLILSDGTSMLRFLDPKTFRTTGRLTVHCLGRPVDKLNELEYVEGEIFANLWGADYLARISPQTGQVLGWIELSGLRRALGRIHPDAVLNGTAYDPETKRLFVTGKLWPKLFEIRLVAKP